MMFVEPQRERLVILFSGLFHVFEICPNKDVNLKCDLHHSGTYSATVSCPTG
jgi:hypothetical protein